MILSIGWRLLGLATLLAAGSAQGAELIPGEKGAKCGSFGTEVEFFASPSAAARRAIQQEKLLFVLHVSGNFEEPRFT